MILRATLRTLLLAFATMALCGCGKGHWENKEIIHGYKGEARRNPFLACQRLLEENDYDTTATRTLDEMPDPYDTLFVAAESVYSAGRARYFLDWARDGGHLVFALRGGTHLQNDWKQADLDLSDLFKSKSPEDSPLLAELDLSVNDRRKETELTYDGLVLEFPGVTGLQFDRPRGDATILGDPFAAAMVSVPHGRGQVTILVDAHCLRNRYLGDHDHGDFLLTLANYRDYGTFWFLLSAKVSFLGLLWSRAWMPVLCLVLLVLFWLWKNLPRFGPYLAPLETHSRKFSEHVDMAGRFLWRRRNTGELLAPLRRRVLHAFSRALGLRPDTPPEEVARRIAERTGLEEKRVRFALTAVNIRDATQLTQTVRDLQKLHSQRP